MKFLYVRLQSSATRDQYTVYGGPSSVARPGKFIRNLVIDAPLDDILLPSVDKWCEKADSSRLDSGS